MTKMFRGLLLTSAILFCMAALSPSALSAEAVDRSIDFSAVMTDDAGQPLPSADAKDAPPLTLALVANRALNSVSQDDASITGEEKFNRGRLAKKVRAGGKMTLSPEDVTLIKKLIGKIYAPIIVEQAWPLLDPTLAVK